MPFVRSTDRVLHRRGCWALVLAALGATFIGCATPIEVKTASRNQLELIAALNDSVVKLGTAMEEFHRTREARIREEGRMVIARQAIDVALPDTKNPRMATADQLFEDYKTGIQPWIDHAFESGDLDRAIKALDDKIKTMPASVQRDFLSAKLDDLREQRSHLKDPPAAVLQADTSVSQQIANDQKTAADVKQAIKLLGAQIDLMKAAAERVDAWLAIDVTPNQEQVDALTKIVTGALTGGTGGGK